VQGDVVAVGVREGEGSTEGSVDRRGDDGVTVCGLETASAAVRAVEVRMLAGLTEAEQKDAFRILRGMVLSLRDGPGPADRT